MAIMAINRRESLRTTKPMIIQFRKVDGSEDSVWDMSVVRNVSSSGAFFNSTYKIPEGQDVEVNLYNPLTETIDQCSATVVRSIDVHEHYLFFETAIRFKQIYHDSLRSLSAFVDRALALV